MKHIEMMESVPGQTNTFRFSKLGLNGLAYGKQGRLTQLRVNDCLRFGRNTNDGPQGWHPAGDYIRVSNYRRGGRRLFFAVTVLSGKKDGQCLRLRDIWIQAKVKKLQYLPGRKVVKQLFPGCEITLSYVRPRLHSMRFKITACRKLKGRPS